MGVCDVSRSTALTRLRSVAPRRGAGHSAPADRDDCSGTDESTSRKEAIDAGVIDLDSEPATRRAAFRARDRETRSRPSERTKNNNFPARAPMFWYLAAVERHVGAGGALDCLVNNAGTAFKGSDPLPFNDQTAPALRTNFYQTLGLTRALLPLLERSTSPRIVNVASMAGRLGKVSPALQRRFSDPQLSLEGG